MIRRLVLAVGAAALLAVPATAAAAPEHQSSSKHEAAPKHDASPDHEAPSTPDVPKATVTVSVDHLRGGEAQILAVVPVTGTLKPFVPGQHVEVTFYRNGHQVVSRKVAVRKGPDETGTFEARVAMKEGGKYAVAAHHDANAKLGSDSTVRKSWKVSFPKLKHGDCGRVVKAFKAHLAKMGYASGGGRCFNGRLGREVLAYRKVNALDRSKKAGPGIVKSVFAGKGGYHVRYPKAGEHAEVSLDKQVLVLVKKGKPFAIYPVSTGKPSTPTVTGHYEFIRTEPGYNSEGMYYSFYFYRGYAVHGYHEVPNYAASHGCVRTFLADQPRVYEQLHYGESIYVF